MEENRKFNILYYGYNIVVCLLLTTGLGGFGPRSNIGDWLIGFIPLYIALYCNK